MIEPVRPVTLGEIEAARARIAGTVLRTPLVRLDNGPGNPDIRLKLENLQPTNSYKIRGAMNAVARLTGVERARGVWTVSAGNAGQAIAFAAGTAGIPCTVVAIESAPQTKLDRMAALGARILPVPYEVAWQAVTDHAYAGMDGRFIHPFDNQDLISGHATMGLEIVEDAPDVAAVICAIGGGGLITGVGSGVKARKPGVRLYGAEPETAAPYALSRREGRPVKFPGWQASFVDGAGGQSLIPRMWERLLPLVDGAVVVSLEQTRQAMRLLAEKARVIAEGAGALSLAAALSGEAGEGPIVCVVSGGNIDLAIFCSLVGD